MVQEIRAYSSLDEGLVVVLSFNTGLVEVAVDVVEVAAFAQVSNSSFAHVGDVGQSAGVVVVLVLAFFLVTASLGVIALDLALTWVVALLVA